MSNSAVCHGKETMVFIIHHMRNQMAVNYRLKQNQHRLFYHKLETKQSADKVIFGDEIKRRYVGGTVSEDEKYLIISAANNIRK